MSEMSGMSGMSGMRDMSETMARASRKRPTSNISSIATDVIWLVKKKLSQHFFDEELTYENFSVSEQAKVIVAPRSNNLLETSRIAAASPEILGIRAVRAAVRKMRQEARASQE